LCAWFTRSGVDTAPASLSDIAALEQRCGVQLPQDFRDYLLAAAPAAENMDAEGTKWWPLDQIKSVPEELNETDQRQAQYLIFADYLVWCYAWAIVCTEDPNHGRVSFIGGRDGFVADSFAEFVDLYLAADPSIHGNSRT
jgi:hypothetical protein